MMKIRKILLSGCLVVTLCSCGGSQNENLNLTLSKDALFDKVKGAWAGQVIGCTYGGYNPQIQISAESGTKRSIFRQKNKTKRSKKRLHTTLIKPEQKVNEDLCSGFIVS